MEEVKFFHPYTLEGFYFPPSKVVGCVKFDGIAVENAIEALLQLLILQGTKGTKGQIAVEGRDRLILEMNLCGRSPDCISTRDSRAIVVIAVLYTCTGTVRVWEWKANNDDEFSKIF